MERIEHTLFPLHKFDPEASLLLMTPAYSILYQSFLLQYNNSFSARVRSTCPLGCLLKVSLLQSFKAFLFWNARGAFKRFKQSLLNRFVTHRTVSLNSRKAFLQKPFIVSVSCVWRPFLKRSSSFTRLLIFPTAFNTVYIYICIQTDFPFKTFALACHCKKPICSFFNYYISP